MAKVGLVHVHSNFSYDGEHTLRDLVAIARLRGFDFVGMTEHANTFDINRMHEFVQQCRALSDHTFLVIPGIEFVCTGDLHILGIGIEHFTDSTDPALVAQFINQQGGLAIVAHPGRNGYHVPKAIRTAIDGIEIWNARYDGWFVPNDSAINLWKDLKRGGGGFIALAGQDLHEMRSHGHVRVIVAHDELTQAAIFRALKSGNFWISNSFLTLDPSTLGGPVRLFSIFCARRMYQGAKSIARPIKRGLLTILRLRRKVEGKEHRKS